MYLNQFCHWGSCSRGNQKHFWRHQRMRENRRSLLQERERFWHQVAGIWQFEGHIWCKKRPNRQNNGLLGLSLGFGHYQTDWGRLCWLLSIFWFHMLHQDHFRSNSGPNKWQGHHLHGRRRIEKKEGREGESRSVVFWKPWFWMVVVVNSLVEFNDFRRNLKCQFIVNQWWVFLLKS